MKKEIERKFLVASDRIPDISRYGYMDITQGYINLDACIKDDNARPIRLRQVLHMTFDNMLIGEDFLLTIKSQDLKVRDELEISLLKQQFVVFWIECEKYNIHKHRYELPSEDKKHIVQLDFHKNELSWLKIAEVEFHSVEDSNKYIPEPWFSDEVTYDKKYASLNLLKSIVRI